MIEYKAMCMHCLEESVWADDDDACPACKAKGHVSPWAVGKCPACNREFFEVMDRLKAQIDERERLAGEQEGQ